MKATVTRIEVDMSHHDARSKTMERKLKNRGINAHVEVSDCYTLVGNYSREEIQKIAEALHDPVVSVVRTNSPRSISCDWVLELGFLPGVTDNVAHTASEIITNLLGEKVEKETVFSSRVLFISGKIEREVVEKIAGELINCLIERYHYKSISQYNKEKGMDQIVPRVQSVVEQGTLEVNLAISDPQLSLLGKNGIRDPVSGKSRGPLALDLPSMKIIAKYFSKLGRAPRDIELESLAQTWSEHCKHTIFSAQLDEIKDGIFSHYIKRATKDIRTALGKNDPCVSVFSDNAGAMRLNSHSMICYKVETHNSPCALDPFGGAVTGIVGVNRDVIGFGMGALPIANYYGFCVGMPTDEEKLYRSSEKKNPLLPPRRILDGVVHGVNVGGNCSGIPTPLGFVYFDQRYKGKPLVYVGTAGILPMMLPSGKEAHLKGAKSGDNIVVVGGSVGKDGIHGATFSSSALEEGSPATAVQIGDPITQKKLSDAIVKEARDRELFHSITDNGAGGLSCSVAEMARECGGFNVELEKVPLKYPGLAPWEIWISESQERMTLAVPDKTLKEFSMLMQSRGVQCSVIGKFDSGTKGIVLYKGKEVFNLDMDFLHDGLPQKKFTTKKVVCTTKEPSRLPSDHQAVLVKLLSSENIASFEYISRQYDHEVGNTSVLKPLQGEGKLNADACVIKPFFNSDEGVVLSYGLHPLYSDIDTYHMAACAIDTALRGAVAAGGDIRKMAILDNFCWCSSEDPERLYQLKEAARACYDYATAYKTPFISGKDSMFNDFSGFDALGKAVKISIPPTLLISSIGVMKSVEETISPDLKCDGDLIYVLGITKDECGGSQYYAQLSERGRNVPVVDAKSARELYEIVHGLAEKKLLSSCISINHGGFAVALAKSCIAGGFGAAVDISLVPTEKPLDVGKILYSETQSRFIISIDPHKKEVIEKMLSKVAFGCIGVVKGEKINVCNGRERVIDVSVGQLTANYRKTFTGY